jgi:2-C-methyl-D-erythritol 4-phosphate cytidylyltransferase
MSQAKTTPRIIALVPSAGVGARAQSQVPTATSNAAMPKQYRLLAGVPMLRHSVQALLHDSRIEQVRVVVALGDLLATQCLAGLPRTVCSPCGGATRAQTVLNGLQDAQLSAHDWVLVHDAARPGLPAQALARLIDSCLSHPVGGLLAMPVADTVKRSHPLPQKTVQQTIARDCLWLAQTPQMFRADLLEKALSSAIERNLSITDESSALEAAGYAPLLVQGSPLNAKVTWPEDFDWVQSWL